MLHFAFVAIFVAVAGSKGSGDSHRSNNCANISDRKQTQTPYVVSIQWNGFHFCTGTIYDRWTIITSAGCVKNIQTDDIPLYTVRAGSVDNRRFGQLVNVKSIIKHPDYIPLTGINDIALIKMLRPLIFGDTIQPIKISKKKLKLPRNALVSGWSDQNHRKDTIKNQFHPIIHFDECDEKYGPFGVNSTILLCMGEGKYENCQGDSGSGMVLDYKFVGIVSHSTRCENREFPSLHTKMTCYGKWLKSQVNSNM